MNRDVRCRNSTLTYIPVRTRVPLKFGAEITTSVTCARVKLTISGHSGRSAEGWGETPLSVHWAWPSELSYEERHAAMKEFCIRLAGRWSEYPETGHPMEIGHSFIEKELPTVWKSFNSGRDGREMPWLAALICCSPFDIALHDAYGRHHDVPTYATYNRDFMNRDLSSYLSSSQQPAPAFHDKYPEDYLIEKPAVKLPAWHLVGGKDLIQVSELTGAEPDDGYPVLLDDWIRRDGLRSLKVKLRGDDGDWDYQRLVEVAGIGAKRRVLWLSADFNCLVREPEYVNAILDKLLWEQPAIYQMILYVEQPFPYDLEGSRIDVHSVSARKPLFMDESAHDWRLVQLGRELGWSGVALKTCKTQTGALLSLCWAKAHGMTLMVQDLTNPMIAQIPHVLLAAHAGTIMGVETNAMQFYPEVSLPEARVHPGLYSRKDGNVDLSTLKGPGFGYRLAEIDRNLPEPPAFQS